MSFAAAAQTLIAAALPDAVVVTETPEPTHQPVEGAPFNPNTGRIRSVVYLYDGPDPQTGPFLTSSQPTLYAACYGATQDAALALARQVRDALPSRTRLDDYRFSPSGVQAPTRDLAYNPPEWYALVRFVGLGLYGDA